MYTPYYNEEVWVDIIDFPGYQVSNTGKIRNIKDFRILGQHLNSNGYYTVTLTKNFEPYTCLVHRLVAIAFIPNPNNLPVVNHKDENTINENVENLEWCDYKYNVNYGTAIQRAKDTRKRNSLLKSAEEARNIILDNHKSNNKRYIKGLDYDDFVLIRNTYNASTKPFIPVNKEVKCKPKKYRKVSKKKQPTPTNFFNVKIDLSKLKLKKVGSVPVKIVISNLKRKLNKN